MTHINKITVVTCKTWSVQNQPEAVLCELTSRQVVFAEVEFCKDQFNLQSAASGEFCAGIEFHRSQTS